MRVAVLGGSSVATVQLADAIRSWPGGAGRRPLLDLTFHGRNQAKLEAVTARFTAVVGPAATARSSLVIEDVLAGADVVLVQVRVGGLGARAHDETYPRKAGLPGEETLGPGGLASALRTVRRLSPTWPTLREYCPEATVVVLTNPAGIVAQAAAAHELEVIEVCDSPVAFLAGIAARLGVPVAQVARRYVGMNHVGWYVPSDARELETLCYSHALAPDIVRAHGAIPLGYVRYYVDADRLYAAQASKPPRAEQLMELEDAALAALSADKRPDPDQRPAPWYRLAVVPLLDGLANGSEEPVIAGVANGERIPAIASDATVEGPVTITVTRKMELLRPPVLPPVPAALLYQHATYEQLALRAAQHPDRTSVLAAMMANPMVAYASQAELLTDDLFTDERYGLASELSVGHSNSAS